MLALRKLASKAIQTLFSRFYLLKNLDFGHLSFFILSLTVTCQTLEFHLFMAFFGSHLYLVHMGKINGAKALQKPYFKVLSATARKPLFWRFQSFFTRVLT